MLFLCAISTTHSLMPKRIVGTVSVDARGIRKRRNDEEEIAAVGASHKRAKAEGDDGYNSPPDASFMAPRMCSLSVYPLTSLTRDDSA